MPSNVYDILNVARVEGGYEDRIPEIDQTNLHELSLLPPETLNEFIGVLTKIVKQYVYDTTFDESDNPFAAFFQEKLPVGGSVEDLYVDLITGDIPAWDDDGSVALSRKKPTVQELYHNHNYEMQYKVSTSFVQARTAFLTEGGVNSLLNRIKGTMNSSAQYDLYLQCLELLSTAITNGAMKEKTGYNLDTEAGIKTFLKDLKLVVKDFKFMNSKYNYYGYTTKTPAEDIIIITKPKYLVKIDVDYLAGVFNLDKAELKGRIIEVPDDYGFGQFDREGSTKEIIAVVMDKRMFRIFPEVFEGGAIYNPASLVTNSFLTLCYIFSYGLFFNAVYFTAGEETKSYPIVVDMSGDTIRDYDLIIDGNVYDPSKKAEIELAIGVKHTAQISYKGSNNENENERDNKIDIKAVGDSAEVTYVAEEGKVPDYDNFILNENYNPGVDNIKYSIEFTPVEPFTVDNVELSCAFDILMNT